MSQREIKNPVLGYVMLPGGYHDAPKMFEGTPENIAAFIMTNAESETIVTDMLDLLVVSSTRGGSPDRFGGNYMHMRQPVLEAIMPMQCGEKEVPEIEYFEY